MQFILTVVALVAATPGLQNPSPADLYVADIVLAAPPGTPEIVPAQQLWDRKRKAFAEVAIREELMDPREERYLFCAREDFLTDIEIIRKRRAELVGAPRLIETRRLPVRSTVNELIKFNREFRKNLEERLPWELDRADRINQAIEETDACYRHWDAIRDAQCDFYYVTVRRGALLRVKQFLGEHDYLAGNMPPYVPHWRFSTAP